MIPDDNDIARYAGWSKISHKTGRLKGSAFHLREDEEYLSVHCLDMLPGDDLSTRVEYLKNDIPRDTGVKGKLGVLNVGFMKECVRSEGYEEPTVTHEPRDCRDERLKCDYHCGVRGIRYDNAVIAELIARRCVKECHPALKKSKFDRISTTVSPESN